MLKRRLPVLAMILGLVLPVGVPEVANIGFFLMAAIGVVIWVRVRPQVNVACQPAVLLPLIAIVLLSVAFLAATGSAVGMMSVLYLAPLLLVGPLAVLLRTGGWATTEDGIATFAIAGSAIGVAIGAMDWWSMGPTRAGAAVNNPIHFGALALSLGFIALAGLYSNRRMIRLASVTGPLWGVVAAWLSGSRGPMVAFPVMFVVACLVLAWQFLPRRQAAAITAVGLAAVVVAPVALWTTGLVADIPVIGMVAGYLQGNATVDGSTSERLAMYGAGLEAFRASLWFGYGLENLIAATERYAPQGVSFAGFDHLHSDIVDFAVIGGIIGLLSYLLILAAGPAQAILARPTTGKRPALLLSITLSAGYLAMGLTNAMIGILTQTMLFALLLALLVRLTVPDATGAKREPASP